MRNFKSINFLYFAVILIGIVLVGADDWRVRAQQGLGATGGDALWHLPRFGETGWFLHAYNGKVRACNMDKVSVVGDRSGPRCSAWQ